MKEFSTNDISGFGSLGESDNVDPSLIEKDCSRFLTILRNCYAELGERDARHAVDRQESDFNFTSDQNASTAALIPGCDSPSLMQLQALDTLSHKDRFSGETMFSVAECLEGLDLRHTLESYIVGLTTSAGTLFSDSDQDALKDKWFKCRLYDMQWNDPLFHEAQPIQSDINMQSDGLCAIPVNNFDQIRACMQSLEVYRTVRIQWAGLGSMSWRVRKAPLLWY